MMEDLIYRRLLDWYYLNEKPIPSDYIQAARLIQAKDHFPEVEQVLNEFFTQTDDGWINKRADEEIAHFKAKSEQASKAGKASAQARFNGRSTDVQPNNNHKPLPNNQEPIKPKPSSASDDAGVSVEYSKAFLAFWDMYPVKKNKGLAYKSFKKIKPAEYPAIKAGLIVAKSSDSWLKDSGQFIPHPSSWLNARGWEDESVSVEPTMLVCPNGFPFSEWMKLDNKGKADVIARNT